jgi:hypothetical protein
MAAVLRTAIQDVPPIGRPEAARLARAEYGRFLEMLRGLVWGVWERPTDCTRWTVKDVAALAEAEYARLLALTDELSPQEWQRTLDRSGSS